MKNVVQRGAVITEGGAPPKHSSNAELSICIVNYKTPQLVINCLASFLPDLTGDIGVVIADNNSRDDSVTQIAGWLKKNDPDRRCCIVELPVNGGFSAGYNAAMRTQPAKLYLLLNSDTLVRSSALAHLLDASAMYPAAGVFSPILESPEGEPQVSCFRHHSPISELIGAARTGYVTSMFRRYVVPLPVDSFEVQPQWVSFAAVLLRHEMLKSAGMLDEGFFLYFEDCEYCHRAHRAGWAIILVPHANIVHLHGQSSQVEVMTSEAKRLPRYYYASRTRYFRLRYGLAGPTLANIGWCIGRLISKAREMFGNKQPHLPEKAWRDIWTNWRSPLAGRKEHS